MIVEKQESIVAALSGDPDADQPVVEKAAEITASTDRRVHFISVVRDVGSAAHYGSVAPIAPAIAAGETAVEHVRDAIVQRTRRINEQMAYGARPKNYSVEVRSGFVDDEIIKAADDHDADLILVGSGDKSWLEGLLGADVAQQITKKSKRPVLVVPAGESAS